MRSLRSKFAGVFSKPSLRFVLILGFVLPLVGSVGLVQYLAWENERQAVDQLVARLQQKVGDRIVERLENFTKEPQQATTLLLNALNRGISIPKTCHPGAHICLIKGKSLSHSPIYILGLKRATILSLDSNLMPKIKSRYANINKMQLFLSVPMPLHALCVSKQMPSMTLGSALGTKMPSKGNRNGRIFMNFARPKVWEAVFLVLL